MEYFPSKLLQTVRGLRKSNPLPYGNVTSRLTGGEKRLMGPFKSSRQTRRNESPDRPTLI